jgi:predicted transposase/invertase (TIGR01784 family)
MSKKQTISENESQTRKEAAGLEITFIDLKIDYAFKWAFGTPGHEDDLLLLLHALLPDKHIKTVHLGPQEQKSDRKDAQSGIFDIQCETDDGSKLTIEMQVCAQADFNDRMVFYSSFPIRDHVGNGVFMKNGEPQHSRYKLPPIYTIGILNFELERVPKSDRMIRNFSIREDEDGNGQFTDSIHYVTVELPKFKKEVSKLKTTQDFMLFLIQNSGEMKEIPKEFQGKGFDKFLERCKFANMTENEQREYISHMKAEWDHEGQLDYAEARGEVKGVEQTARAMKADGVPVDIISKYTGLTPEQIQSL